MTVDFLFEYTGRYTDPATNLQWNNGRWYDPALQRWLSADPIDADQEPFRYASNDPVNLVDPSGLEGLAPSSDLPYTTFGGRQTPPPSPPRDEGPSISAFPGTHEDMQNNIDATEYNDLQDKSLTHFLSYEEDQRLNELGRKLRIAPNFDFNHAMMMIGTVAGEAVPAETSDYGPIPIEPFEPFEPRWTEFAYPGFTDGTVPAGEGGPPGIAPTREPAQNTTEESGFRNVSGEHGIDLETYVPVATGRAFSNHALERMAERGVTQDSVLEAISKGRTVPGNTPGTTVYQLPAAQSTAGRDVIAVVDDATGKVITVIDRGIEVQVTGNHNDARSICVRDPRYPRCLHYGRYQRANAGATHRHDDGRRTP